MSQRIKNIGLYVMSVIILVFIDQLTKMAAVITLKGKNPFVIIKGVLEFCYLQNDGAAWGMLSGGRVIFIIVTIVIVVVLAYIITRIPMDKKYLSTRIVITMLTAGAIGNLIDRLLNGYVNDFIYFKLINFPIFNIADMYVTVSVFIFCILILFVYQDGDFAFLNFKKK